MSSSIDADLKLTKMVIRSLLTTYKDPILIEELDTNYMTTEGRRIPFQKFNFRNLIGFLMSMPDIVYIEKRRNNFYVKGVAGEKTRHISDMVLKQKAPSRGRSSSRSRRGRPPPTRSYSQPPLRTSRRSSSYNREESWNYGTAESRQRSRTPSSHWGPSPSTFTHNDSTQEEKSFSEYPSVACSEKKFSPPVDQTSVDYHTHNDSAREKKSHSKYDPAVACSHFPVEQTSVDSHTHNDSIREKKSYLEYYDPAVACSDFPEEQTYSDSHTHGDLTRERRSSSEYPSETCLDLPEEQAYIDSHTHGDSTLDERSSSEYSTVVSEIMFPLPPPLEQNSECQETSIDNLVIPPPPCFRTQKVSHGTRLIFARALKDISKNDGRKVSVPNKNFNFPRLMATRQQQPFDTFDNSTRMEQRSYQDHESSRRRSSIPIFVNPSSVREQSTKPIYNPYPINIEAKEQPNQESRNVPIGNLINLEEDNNGNVPVQFSYVDELSSLFNSMQIACHSENLSTSHQIHNNTIQEPEMDGDFLYLKVKKNTNEIAAVCNFLVKYNKVTCSSESSPVASSFCGQSSEITPPPEIDNLLRAPTGFPIRPPSNPFMNFLNHF